MHILCLFLVIMYIVYACVDYIIVVFKYLQQKYIPCIAWHAISKMSFIFSHQWHISDLPCLYKFILPIRAIENSKMSRTRNVPRLFLV